MHTEFDKRMKTYEKVSRTFLIKKTPVIIRIDGKAFHTVLSRFKPLDIYVNRAFKFVTENLIKEIQGVKIAYHQSDEISLILTDYDNKNTQGWFDYRTDKICSVASSLTTFYFMKYSFENNLICMMNEPIAFDARCFNIPEDDAINYFIWRQEDAIRNSIFSFSRQYHSHNELLNKTKQDLLEMDKDVYGNCAWDTYLEYSLKYGTILTKYNRDFIEHEIQFKNNRDFFESLYKQKIDEVDILSR